MKIYLDNCCFNRPYDDQTQVAIKLESEAKLSVQSSILRGDLDFTWSYVLDFENLKNPFPEKRSRIQTWKELAVDDVEENDCLLEDAKIFVSDGIKPLDALHLACAVSADCRVFLTTDKGILKKRNLIHTIQVLNPVEFVVNSTPDPKAL